MRNLTIIALLTATATLTACKTTSMNNALAVHTLEENCSNNEYYFSREVDLRIVDADTYYATPENERHTVGKTVPNKLFYCKDQDANTSLVRYDAQKIEALDKEYVYVNYASRENLIKRKSYKK